MTRKNVLNEEDSLDLTPMIDIVFLLLVYFMVTMKLIKEEADLGMTLPSESESNESPPDDIPEEVLVEVLPDASILLNGSQIDVVGSRKMPELTRTLSRLKKAADRIGVPFFVTILADPDSLHGRAVDVLNACATAEVKMVSFANHGE